MESYWRLQSQTSHICHTVSVSSSLIKMNVESSSDHLMRKIWVLFWVWDLVKISSETPEEPHVRLKVSFSQKKHLRSKKQWKKVFIRCFRATKTTDIKEFLFVIFFFLFLWNMPNTRTKRLQYIRRWIGLLKLAELV